MNDAEYLFRQTEIERKRAGYGDRHKKRQGGRHVRLPSDHRTKKELAAMNGEVKTYKEKPFYTREEFVELPEDLRLKWVNSIINRYCVGRTSVARIIFGQKDFLDTRVDLQYVNKGPHGAGAAKGNKKLAADFWAFKNGAETAATLSEASGTELHTQEPETKEDAVPAAENSAETQSEPEKLGIDAVVALVTALQSLAGTGAKLTIEVTL